MFSHLLAEHFVQTALWAGAVAAVVSGAIGVFVVARGMSFAVHAISELGFTGAAGALVIGINPVTGILGGSLAPYIASDLAESYGVAYVGYYVSAAAAVTLAAQLLLNRRPQPHPASERSAA